MFLRIQNDGVADLDLFLRIGASSSRGDSSRIGKFGTGAVMGVLTALCEGYNPIVFCGLKRIKYLPQEPKTASDPRGNRDTFTPVS